MRVTLPQTRVALLGGMLLVAVHILAEFGAFSMLRFQTFTTAIYDQYRLSFDGAAASMLASVLVLCASCSCWRAARPRSGSLPPRRLRLAPPGAARQARALEGACAGALTVLAAALGLPLATLVYWTGEAARPPSPAPCSPPRRRRSNSDSPPRH